MLRRFGLLKESETEVCPDFHRARVIFKRQKLLVVDQEGSMFLGQWLSLTAWLLSINYSCCKDQKTHPDVTALDKGVTGSHVMDENLESEMRAHISTTWRLELSWILVHTFEQSRMIDVRQPTLSTQNMSGGC